MNFDNLLKMKHNFQILLRKSSHLFCLNNDVKILKVRT